MINTRGKKRTHTDMTIINTPVVAHFGDTLSPIQHLRLASQKYADLFYRRFFTQDTILLIQRRLGSIYGALLDSYLDLRFSGKNKQKLLERYWLNRHSKFSDTQSVNQGDAFLGYIVFTAPTHNDVRFSLMTHWDKTYRNLLQLKVWCMNCKYNDQDVSLEGEDDNQNIDDKTLDDMMLHLMQQTWSVNVDNITAEYDDPALLFIGDEHEEYQHSDDLINEALDLL